MSSSRHEPADAYAADALLAMARAAADDIRPGRPTPEGAANPTAPAESTPSPRRRVPSKIIVRIDWDAFLRGYPAGDECCEIAGLGPVPVSVVRAMAESGDAFLAAVVTRGTDVATVAHLGRRPTAHQRTGLEWRDPLCTVEGCANTANLEIDHRADWAAHRITALWLLDRCCSHHHDLKTYEGWALVSGSGKRPMVPPGHPHHPDAAGSAKQRPPPEAA